jgi:hypothetical protein
VVKAAGYKGLVIVIDEAETILRMRGDVRGKSLNGIRQIIDAADRFKGLFWVFTGTPDFFDNRRGVAGLQPLHDRIGFKVEGGLVSMRQPQLELKPFDHARLKDVGLRLRELYPTGDPNHVKQKVTPDVIAGKVDEVTKGFGGDVGIVPRQFLRSLVRTDLNAVLRCKCDRALARRSPLLDDCARMRSRPSAGTTIFPMTLRLAHSYLRPCGNKGRMSNARRGSQRGYSTSPRSKRC